MSTKFEQTIVSETYDDFFDSLVDFTKEILLQSSSLRVIFGRKFAQLICREDHIMIFLGVILINEKNPRNNFM